jgi:hypothetical protein
VKVYAGVVVFLMCAVACGGPRRSTQRVPPRATADPYKAALAYAHCMRAHGVAHPDPDKAGNFHLTLHQEQLMRRGTRRQRQAADRACFRYLRPVVSTEPLSSRAKAQARAALRSFAGCMKSRGYDFFESTPVVRNLSRGRAFFGFERADPRAARAQKSPRFLRERAACEQKLNARLDAIIADDRHEPQY